MQDSQASDTEEDIDVCGVVLDKSPGGSFLAHRLREQFPQVIPDVNAWLSGKDEFLVYVRDDEKCLVNRTAANIDKLLGDVLPSVYRTELLPLGKVLMIVQVEAGITDKIEQTIADLDPFNNRTLN